jgi:23S rRNA pseudouridine955/2504/2580 synthase
MAGADARPRSVQLVTVDDRNDGQRLDNFLISRLKGVPRSWIYRILRRGEVRVNKGRCKPARRLQVGDVVRIPPLRQTEKTLGMPADGLIQLLLNSIIYEDSLMFVVNKPAGVAVHGGSGLAHGVIEILRAAWPEAAFLELVHRLDRETSGCLMVAKTRASLKMLQELQRAGQIEKRYLALLAGRIRKGAWRADLPLKKNTLKSGERVVRVDPQGKPAVTHFKVMRRYAASTLVEVGLETGRTHQIRVHAAANGTPILGDPKYGNESANRAFREIGLRRLFLHAASLHFDWPRGGGRFFVEAALPSDLQALLETLDTNEQKV